jgi:Viral BACON domain
MNALDSQDNNNGRKLQPLTVSQRSLDFDTIPKGGGYNGEMKPIALPEVISNEGEQPLLWSADTGETSWINLDKTAGTLQPGERQTINVTVDTSSLAVGTYIATLTLTSEGEETSVSTQVPVSLVISPLLPPSVLLFFGNLAPNSSGTLQQVVWNQASKTVKWTADTGGTSWLTLDQQTGILQPGEQQLINVTVNTRALTDGDYYATLTFTSEVMGARSVGTPVQVMLYVSKRLCPYNDDGPHPPCGIRALSFDAHQVGSTPLKGKSDPLPLVFVNPDVNGKVDWTLDACGIEWIQIAPKAGTLDPNNQQMVQVWVDTTNLNAGTYHVDLILTFTYNPRRGGHDSISMLIPVTMTVS